MTDEENAIKKMEANIKNLATERESYPDKLKHNEKLLDRINRQLSTREKFHEVVMRGLKRVEPIYVYEADDEYWELNKQLQTLQYESELDKMLFEKKKIEFAIRDIKIEMERIDRELPLEEQKLKEMKGE